MSQHSLASSTARHAGFRRLGRRARTLRALLVGGSVAAIAALGAPAASQAAITAYNDPFYVPTDNMAELAPGTIMKTRETAFRTSPGLKLPFKTYQLLYRTTNRLNQPIIGVATVIMPLKLAPVGQRKLVSYQTAYDGLNPTCRPSYSLQGGTESLQSLETVLMSAALMRGWIVVTTDYEGPNDEFGIGKVEGQSVLDGIRAAENYAPIGLTQGAKTPVGMLGYSGGGQATAWAAELAAGYAPELNIVGAAQGGVGGDLRTVQIAFDGQLFSGIGLAGINALGASYPEANLDGELNARGKKVFAKLRKMTPCITGYALAYSGLKFNSLTKTPHLLRTPKWIQMAKENSLGQGTPKFPVLWYHTYYDQMNQAGANLKIAHKYCDEGSPLRFELSYKEEHASQAFSMPLKAQGWLAARFNGSPVNSNCGQF